MPKITSHRRGRFLGPYRFAPSEPPDDSLHATAGALRTRVPTKTGPKPRIKGHELVFLVNWLDVCIMNGEDDLFQESLVKEFQKRFGRVVNAKTAEGKVVVNLQELAGRIGSKYVSKREVLSKGSRCIEWHRAPEELIFEYNSMRQELGLPLIIADEAETMRNKLFRASESSTEEELDPLSEREQQLAPRLEPPPRIPSSRPSPFRSRSSPSRDNHPSETTSKLKNAITSIVAAPAPAPASVPVPVSVRVESEDFESAIENQDSETDSTIVSKGQEEIDSSQTNWHVVGEACAGASEHQPDARDRKIGMLSNMVSWLLQRQRDGWNGSEAELARLERIRKEVVSDHDHAFASLLDKLSGEERKATKFQTIIRSVIGTINLIEPDNVHAPQAPITKAIDREWRLLWERCRLLTQTILVDRRFVDEDFRRLHESINVTWRSDPHYKAVIQQSADHPGPSEEDVLLKLHGSMARLLFIFVFEYPTPLLQDQHSDLLRHLYTMIGAAGDMSEVKRLDLLATEMLLKEERVQNNVIHQKAEQRCAWISQMLGLNSTPEPYDTIAGDLRELCYRAIKLYSQLLVSPLEYCIHFFPRGTLFDEPSMKVENNSGAALPTSRCLGRTVKLCLFPAIWQYCDQPLNQSRDVADALTASKKFLRTHMSETNAHLSLVSKAVVVLE